MHGAKNHLSCYIVISYKTWGERAWTRQFAVSPHSTPSGSLASHSVRSPSSVTLPCRVTLTLGFISCNSSSYNNNQLHPQDIANPTPGITWDSCCSSCPHGARRATHHMCSAFIFHGQVQSTVCLRETSGKPPQGQLCLCGAFILRTRKIAHRHWAHPCKEGIFVAITAHPHDSKCFHTVLNLQENQN